MRQSVERVASHPALRNEMKRIEQSLRQLEERLGRGQAEAGGQAGEEEIVSAMAPQGSKDAKLSTESCDFAFLAPLAAILE